MSNKISLKLTTRNILSATILGAFIFHLIFQLCSILIQGINHDNCSEFLVNFQGGFVRRGLIGDVLYQFSNITGITPMVIIIPLSVLSLSFVIYFFTKHFRKRNMDWWIIFSPLFCGFVTYFIRKDFILYALLILTLYLIKKYGHTITGQICATILAIIGLYFHEAYVFWGIPIIVLVMTIYQRRHIAANIICIVAIIVNFMLLCAFKGDSSYIQPIMESWNSIEGITLTTCGVSINALGWDTIETFKFHLKMNFCSEIFGNAYWAGIAIRSIFFVLAYYLISNFPYAMKMRNTDFTITDKTNLSTLYIITSICMLPMFVLLSCDYARLYQYISVTAFATIIIIPREKLQTLFPSKITLPIKILNEKIASILPPTKGVMITLLLILASSTTYFSFESAFNNSIIGTYFRTASILCDLISKHI